MKKMVIAGANGFIARNLSRYFAQRGWEIVGLARRNEGLHEECRFVQWDGESLGDWVAELERCDLLINMVGRSINCRHNEENKRQILDSRVASTRSLAEAIRGCDHPPDLWINGSASGIYAESYTQAHGESGALGEGFIADVVKAWEEAFFDVEIRSSVRRIALRTTMVLADEEGNPFRILSNLANWGLGGRAGSGKQMVSWIHIEDLCRAVEFLIDQKQVNGPVNLAAPDAVTNAEMMGRFRKRVGMPLGMPAPAFGVRIGACLMGTAPELILNSTWVSPEKLLESGFVFKYPSMNLWEW